MEKNFYGIFNKESELITKEYNQMYGYYNLQIYKNDFKNLESSIFENKEECEDLLDEILNQKIEFNILDPIDTSEISIKKILINTDFKIIS